MRGRDAVEPAPHVHRGNGVDAAVAERGLCLLLPRAQEVRAEPQVDLHLDEQVGQADETAARIEPVAQLGEVLVALGHAEGRPRVGTVGSVASRSSSDDHRISPATGSSVVGVNPALQAHFSLDKAQTSSDLTLTPTSPTRHLKR